MEDLIKRLEAAEVGSLELDGEIYEALNPTHRSVPHQIGRYFDPAVISVHAAEKYITKGTFVAPRYTTSLDAALALAERVLPGWLWTVGTALRGGNIIAEADAYDVNGDGDAEWFCQTEASTPALALCIAILRAKLIDTDQNPR